MSRLRKWPAFLFQLIEIHYPDIYLFQLKRFIGLEFYFPEFLKTNFRIE
jgi:hypothetical protein